MANWKKCIDNVNGKDIINSNKIEDRIVWISINRYWVNIEMSSIKHRTCLKKIIGTHMANTICFGLFSIYFKAKNFFWLAYLMS